MTNQNNNEELYDDEIENIDTELSGVTDDIKNIVNDLLKQLKITFSEFVDKFNDFSNSDAFEKYINQFKATVKQYSDIANDKIHQITNDEKVLAWWDDVKESYSTLSETVIKSATNVYNRALENPEIAKTVEFATDKSKELIEIFNNKYQEFIHNPKVRSTVVGATEVVNLAINKIKEKYFNEDKKEQ